MYVHQSYMYKIKVITTIYNYGVLSIPPGIILMHCDTEFSKMKLRVGNCNLSRVEVGNQISVKGEPPHPLLFLSLHVDSSLYIVTCTCTQYLKVLEYL